MPRCSIERSAEATLTTDDAYPCLAVVLDDPVTVLNNASGIDEEAFGDLGVGLVDDLFRAKYADAEEVTVGDDRELPFPLDRDEVFAFRQERHQGPDNRTAGAADNDHAAIISFTIRSA